MNSLADFLAGLIVLVILAFAGGCFVVYLIGATT